MKKILIIEDEKIIRNELKSLLENSGYEVLIIEKFDNVKENIKNMKFDLILMDNNMDDLFYDNISVNPQKGILKQGEKVLELTKNEMIIFTYLLSNRGRIVTRDDLMTDLWNNNEFINDNALTVNISRLRNKLQNFGLENRIETRKGQGYKLL